MMYQVSTCRAGMSWAGRWAEGARGKRARGWRAIICGVEGQAGKWEDEQVVRVLWESRLGRVCQETLYAGCRNGETRDGGMRASLCCSSLCPVLENSRHVLVLNPMRFQYLDTSMQRDRHPWNCQRNG